MKNTWELDHNRHLVNTEDVDGYGTQKLYLTHRKDGVIFNHTGVINGTSVAGIPLEALDALLYDAGYMIVKRNPADS